MKSKFATAAVVAVGAMAVPAVASAATAVPPLQAGDTQAYASLTNGGARIAAATSRNLSGLVTLAPVGSPFRITCNITASVTFNVDGTTAVTVANFSACDTNVQGCSVVAGPTAGSLSWGNRLVTNGAVPPVYRDRINVAFTNMLSGVTCPAQGSFNYTGVLSPVLTGGAAGVANATFDGAAAGTVTSALGPATATGALTLEAGQSPIWFRN